MEVLFKTIAENYHSVNLGEGFENVNFRKGIYSTTDKEVVKALLRNTAKKRGYISMLTDQGLVSEWLENDTEPSYITEDYIDGLTPDAYLKLKALVGVESDTIPLIKEELIGYPVTNSIAEIVENGKARPVTEDTVAQAIANGVIVRAGAFYKDSENNVIGKTKEDAIEWLRKIKEGN